MSTESQTATLRPGFYRLEMNRTTWEIPTHYENLSPVGMGAYGLVCSAFDTRTKMNVAIKKFSRPFVSELHAKRCYRELLLLKFVQHENVIGLIDLFSPATCVDDFNDVYVVTELMDADVQNIIKTHRLEEEQIQFLVYEILRGLKYIHSAGIVHRDLKPSNLAVTSDYDLRILDFGLARHADAEMTGYVATRWYRAPEIMLNWMHYDTKVDVWSVGCIMAEMFIGKPLFPGNEHIDQLSRILQLCGQPNEDYLSNIDSADAAKFIRTIKVQKKSFKDIFPNVSETAVDLLERMLELDPRKRISVFDALAHPFFEGLHDEADEPTAPEAFVEKNVDKEYDVETWQRLCWEELQLFEPRIPPGLAQRIQSQNESADTSELEDQRIISVEAKVDQVSHALGRLDESGEVDETPHYTPPTPADTIDPHPS